LFTAINAEDKNKILVGKSQGVKFLKGQFQARVTVHNERSVKRGKPTRCN